MGTGGRQRNWLTGFAEKANHYPFEEKIFCRTDGGLCTRYRDYGPSGQREGGGGFDMITLAT
jgi:hypothetical protein